jgi:hypothetical protein
VELYKFGVSKNVINGEAANFAERNYIYLSSRY